MYGCYLKLELLIIITVSNLTVYCVYGGGGGGLERHTNIKIHFNMENV